MATKRRIDLDRLSIPKADAVAAVPFTPPPKPVEVAPQAMGRSLTVKLNGTDYWRLRDYCTQQERQTGRRLTHQEAMVTALRRMLDGET